MVSVCRIYVLAIVVPVLGGLTRAEASSPRSAGPYLVGVKTMVLVDTDRTCPITHGKRTLVTEVWYPAAKSAKALPVNKFSQFWPGLLGTVSGRVAIRAFGGNFTELNRRFKNRARRDAELARGVFPMLVFSHGNGGFRFQNTFQMEYLASHGYIVAACDHTGNAAVTMLSGLPLLYNKQTIKDIRRWDDRVKDIVFVVDQIEQFNKQEGAWLRGKIKRGGYGALGHSFGGFTVSRLSETDPRVKAILPMTVAGTLYDVKDLAAKSAKQEQLAAVDIPNIPCRIPLMVILADHDRTIGDEGNRRSKAYFERAVGPRYLLCFKGAGHFTFTDMPQINPNFGDGIGVEKGKKAFRFSDAEKAQRITNQYSVAFFDAFLKQDVAAKAFLDKNHFPDELTYEKKNGK